MPARVADVQNEHIRGPDPMNKNNLPGTYRTIDHTADVGFEFEASTLPALFQTAGLALFHEMVSGAGDMQATQLSVEVSGLDLEDLLIRFLNELLYVFEEERQVINNHISVTIKMLQQLPFPKHLQNVPEYAGGHHERMDGKGYPQGLTREQMSWQARMMGVADIFEALTAKDRPYKAGKKLSQCLEILGRMKLDHHIDPDIFDVFVKEKVYLKYAAQFLDDDQVDEVDHAKIPGFGVKS